MEKKILIVDDAPYIRLLLEECLEEFTDAGAVLMFAEDGATALELILREKPALVFLDVMLPRMNGFEVCHTIKNELGMSGVHVIILTAKGQEFDKVKGGESGADRYITKPFKPHEIVEETARILGMPVPSR